MINMSAVTLTLQTALHLLKNSAVATVVVGEVALNYYNVPCVLHVAILPICTAILTESNMLQDIEICVPSSQFNTALSALNSSPLFEKLPPRTPNLYNEYKKDCPRLLDVRQPHTPITLVSDHGIGTEKTEILEPATHIRGASYSDQILDYISVEGIKSIPIPTLRSFVQYLCLLFFHGADDMYRIRLEQLVDGMNLDEEWCRKNLADERHLQYLLKLVNSKEDRIDDFSGNLVTCYIAEQEAAATVTRIPGY